MIKRIFPARDAHAPFVARFQPRESEFRMRRNQIIAVQHGKIQKLPRHLNADGMLADILRTCSTKTVAIEARQWTSTTTLQFCPENVRRHKRDKAIVLETI